MTPERFVDKTVAIRLKELKNLSEDLGLPLYIVGGTLRDAFLGLPCSDYDFACRDAPHLARLFASKTQCPLVPLDDTPGRETFRAVIRKQVYFDFSRLQGASLDEDLSRRDFTINAMGLPLADFLDGKTVPADPYGGRNDLRDRIVRVLPGPIFGDDPLRTLRAFRFAAALKFRIEAGTLDAISQFASQLNRVAQERIRYELLLFLDCEDTYALAESMDRTGLMESVFPEIASLRLVKDATSGIDAWSQTLQTYRAVENFLRQPEILFGKQSGGRSPGFDGENRSLLKMAALLHRLSDEEPETLSEKTRAGRSGNNEPVLNRLRASNAETAFVERTIKFHRTALTTGLEFAVGEIDESRTYYFVKECGKELLPALVLAAASHGARRGAAEGEAGPLAPAIRNIHDFYVRKFLPAQGRPVLLNGDDLIRQFKLSPSPIFKTLLERVEEARVLGNVKTRKEAEDLARDLLNSPKKRDL